MNSNFNVIGAGLAGCEAANYLSRKQYHVNLYEMKPDHHTEAHKSDLFSELVCSNSLKNSSITTACGLLKCEMSLLGSLILESGLKNSLPAGSALAVDREGFSKYITDRLSNDKNITVINKKINSIQPFIDDKETTTIICTGPLTAPELANNLSDVTGKSNLFFFDAVSPSIELEDIDMSNAYMASRYGKGEAAYINCPFTKDEYGLFYNFVSNADTAILKDFENKKVFESCMPFEILAKRGIDTLRYGPMKPIGLTNPHRPELDYAVLQLRQDNKEATIYDLVGFQTNLTFPAQRELMKYIPALKNARIVRYGVMHKNIYLKAPDVLNRYFQMKEYCNIFFGGQISGVEGYMESAVSGLVAAINAVRKHENNEMIDFTRETMIGSLQHYISNGTVSDFQPMNANYGIVEPLETHVKTKKLKYEIMAQRSIDKMKEIIRFNGI